MIPQASSQDCNITNPRHLVYGCENGVFFIDLNFQTSNTQDTFRIFANGVLFGNFPYQDFPLSLGPLLENGNDWLVEITDINQDSCQLNVPIGVIDCNALCQIVDINVSTEECHTNGTYPATINVTASGPSSNFVDLYTQGDSIGRMRIIENNFRIDSFPASGAIFDTITACIVDDSTCCLTETFLSEDCTACIIKDPTVEISECANGNVIATIDFDVANGGASGFRVGGNETEYGSFSYDSLPIEVGPIQVDSGVIYEFIIVDNENGLCFNFIEAGLISCDSSCIITNINANPTDCQDNGQFFIDIDFDFLNTDSSGFDILVDGMVTDTFMYESLPIQIGPFVGDGVSDYRITARDIGNDQCSASTSVDSVFCPIICSMENLNIVLSECDSLSFFAEIFFTVNNGGPGGFIVSGNDSIYGNFEYTDLPIQLGPFPGDTSTIYEFMVMDSADNTCFVSEVIGKVDCFPSSNVDLLAEDFINVITLQDEIIIKFKEKSYESNLYNINGKLIANYPKQNELSITRKLHPKGLYIFQIRTDLGNVVYKLFL
ncbi:MAG: T9SS type A sorting domain-containing protein [Bacteroidota bacterium]